MQGHLNVLREMYFPDTKHPGPLLRFSPRMTRRGGSFNLDTRNIAIALALYNEYGIDEIIDTIKHELIHWARPDDEQPHGEEFERETERVGCNLLSPQFAEERHYTSNKRYTYACRTCRHRTIRKKRGELSCAKCHPQGYDEEFALVLAEKVILR